MTGFQKTDSLMFDLFVIGSIAIGLLITDSMMIDLLTTDLTVTNSPMTNLLMIDLDILHFGVSSQKYRRCSYSGRSN